MPRNRPDCTIFAVGYNSIKTINNMKIKDIYKVRQVAGENLVVEQGKLQADMTKVISLNATALLLWNELKGRDFSLSDAASVLTANYGIDQARAEADAQKWVDALKGCGVIG